MKKKLQKPEARIKAIEQNFHHVHKKGKNPDLAQKLGLDASEAHGPNGWLKKDSDGKIVDTESLYDSDGGSYPYYVPNTFVVKNGRKMELPTTVAKTISMLRDKKFHVKEDFGVNPDASVYGAILLGHFYGGIFSPDGSGSGAMFNAQALRNTVGHRIVYFAGYGCTVNSRAKGNDWGTAVISASEKNLWMVEYDLYYINTILKVDIDRDINTELLPSRSDDRQELDASSSTIRRKPGDSGISFEIWLKQIDNQN